MSLLFCDSFDAYSAVGDFLDKWLSDTLTSFVSNGGKFGGGCANFSSGGGGAYAGIISPTIGLSSSNTLNFGFYVKFDSALVPGSAPSVSSQAGLGIPNANSSVGTVWSMTTSGTMQALKAGTASTTALATGTKLMNDGNYHWVEISIVLSASSGTFKVWIDGILDINFSGVTWGSGALTGNFALYNIPASSTRTAYYDDVIVWDNTGSFFNTVPLGARRIGYLTPNGAGASTQFTPSAGSNYACVNQAYSGTANVSNASTGQTDLYTTAGLAFTPAAAINAVVLNHYSINPAADGTKSLTGKLRSGASPAVASGTTRTLSGVLTTYQDAFYQDSSATNWTTTTVNSAQPGIGD
jgi:hypothetical protein